MWLVFAVGLGVFGLFWMGLLCSCCYCLYCLLHRLCFRLVVAYCLGLWVTVFVVCFIGLLVLIGCFYLGFITLLLLVGVFVLRVCFKWLEVYDCRNLVVRDDASWLITSIYVVGY